VSFVYSPWSSFVDFCLGSAHLLSVVVGEAHGGIFLTPWGVEKITGAAGVEILLVNRS